MSYMKINKKFIVVCLLSIRCVSFGHLGILPICPSIERIWGKTPYPLVSYHFFGFIVGYFSSGKGFSSTDGRVLPGAWGLLLDVSTFVS